MTKENMKELEELGFVWDAKSSGDWRQKDRIRKQALVEANWQRHYDALLKFVQEHGHTRLVKLVACCSIFPLVFCDQLSLKDDSKIQFCFCLVPKECPKYTRKTSR